MAKISLEDVSHQYEEGVEWAVKDVNLEVPDGAAASLLGPSGCGKTTLMKIISGLLEPTEGRVYFDGEDVTGKTPQERNICMVFQFPVVYSGMDVEENLEFPLKNRGVPDSEIEKRVSEVSEMLGVEDILHTDVATLGPGDKQLVSLGRTIVREDPNIIMLDEPLSDVEPDRRLEMRRLIEDVQKRLQTTMVYVTHDQTEALTFAEEVAVMRDGQILQFAPKGVLYNRPSHPFIGYFIGSPGMNFLDCKLADSKLDFGDFEVDISEEMKSTIKPEGPTFQMGIRPRWVNTSLEEIKNSSPFECKGVEFRGDTSVLILKKGDSRIYASVKTEKSNISKGDKVWVQFSEEDMRIFNEDKELI